MSRQLAPRMVLSKLAITTTDEQSLNSLHRHIGTRNKKTPSVHSGFTFNNCTHHCCRAGIFGKKY